VVDYANTCAVTDEYQ
jgi:chitinase